MTALSGTFPNGWFRAITNVKPPLQTALRFQKERYARVAPEESFRYKPIFDRSGATVHYRRNKMNLSDLLVHPRFSPVAAATRGYAPVVAWTDQNTGITFQFGRDGDAHSIWHFSARHDQIQGKFLAQTYIVRQEFDPSMGAVTYLAEEDRLLWEISPKRAHLHPEIIKFTDIIGGRKELLRIFLDAIITSHAFFRERWIFGEISRVNFAFGRLPSWEEITAVRNDVRRGG
ncbi:hypothetical protein VVT58_24180 (plasmid) [Sphingobium sp. SJ10-10]|uniref:hypothetical protein n=1 Tax=Sphingobium sp. SJ10-10 TaxID=3114999 RepID=UPI002E191927|nr:hypothetical protein [Sphingobium sp. SJ10-10]